MPIVVKRIRKYFPGREHIFVPGLFENPDNSDGLIAGGTNDSELLRTIKL